MKKVLIFLLAVSLFTACNNDKKNERDKNPIDRNKDDYRNDDKKPTDDRTNDDRNDDVKPPVDDNNGGGWTKADENKFMDDCEGTAKPNVGAARANEYCDCMLQKIKRMYSSYAEADRELAGKDQTEINKLAAACNGQ